ncbi:response regulator [Demequina mangrovi]|uniref:Two-component system, chemotaxis family, response regulator CheY n=1 Tax=Demequina mangrovi TaxID=1043493 RepID=A0A1H7A1A9_9MICO|nr:response regulator [Demequina mangrovi]SEJ55630.1 two-component system, chemotaxis family, response regulator CheY [Demequina mangrovi]
MKALVIDDSRVMRRIIGAILTDVGFEVIEAGDGQEALMRLEQHPDVRLCCIDWNMPVMNGYEFIVATRKRPEYRDITLMMITTEGEQEQIVRALAAGAHEYVIKPFTADVIVDKLGYLGLLDAEVHA